MGLFSLFNSDPLAPVPAEVSLEPAESPDELWRHTPFASFVAGEDVHSVYVRDCLPALVPSFVVDFALRCTDFRPLPEHIALHAELYHWGSLEIEALRSWLPKMKSSGMLISRGQLYTRAASMRSTAGEAARIGAIGFPTGGDRVDMLLRALGSFAENVRAHGRSVDFLVADSSTDGGQRGRNRGRAGELGRDRGLRVRYLGEQEKRRFAEELVRRSGCPSAVVEFGLFDPLGAGFTCGANRNALLLHEAGEVFSSVDDDVLCELAGAPPSEARLALFSGADPYERWVYPDRESALHAVHFAPHDYLAEHEKLLGRDLGALLDGVSAREFDVSNAGPGILRLLEFGAARVHATFTGYVGDPGIPTSCFYFFHKGRNRERLTQSEESYRAGFGSRSVLTRAPVLSLGDDSVSPGMAIGLDHRELLPPFFPVLHAEDMVFGAAAWRCCAGSVSGHLPLSVHHDSGANKPTLQPGDLTADRRAAVFEFTQIVRAIMAGFQPAAHFDSATRMQKLGRHLAEFGALPAEDFREALHHVVLSHESHKIVTLEESLRAESDAPEFWRRDMQDFLDHTREALQHEDFDIPYELKTGRTGEENRTLMQQLIGGYGMLLEEWPWIVSAARDLRQEGKLFSTDATAE